MLDRPALTALALCALLCTGAGCGGCQEQETPAAAAPRAEPAPPAEVRDPLAARLAKRKLERDKSYPRGEDGAVACARDADCFIVQAESCSPATLEHSHSATGYGLEQRANSTFRITGKSASGCKLERRVTELRVRMATRLEQMLQQQGKTAQDLQQLRDKMLGKLRERNPPEVVCDLASDRVLALALDLAEGRFDPHSLTTCSERAAPEPTQLSELQPEAEPGPTTGSEAKAKPTRSERRAPRAKSQAVASGAK